MTKFRKLRSGRVGQRRVSIDSATQRAKTTTIRNKVIAKTNYELLANGFTHRISAANVSIRYSFDLEEFVVKVACPDSGCTVGPLSIGIRRTLKNPKVEILRCHSFIGHMNRKHSETVKWVEIRFVILLSLAKVKVNPFFPIIFSPAA